MATPLRVAAIALGFTLGGLLLSVLGMILPGIWLPLALAVAFGLILHAEPWLRKRSLATPITATVAFGCLGGWFASSQATGSGIDFGFLPAEALELLSVLSLTAAVIIQLRQPAKLRPAGWWMFMPPLMAWLVSLGSSSSGGSGGMVKWVEAHLHLNSADAELFIHYLRKSIHFTFYGLLGLTARNAAARGGEKGLIAARFGLSLTLAVAAFDELRQASQPGRTSSIMDVLLDLTGAVVFIAIVSAFGRAKAPRRQAA